MFGSAILEVAIGVIFVFLLMSIICSAIREGIEAWMKTRAAFLEHGIRELLHDKNGQGLAKSFYDHPMIYGLFAQDYKPGSESNQPHAWTSGAHLPSYIPAKNFALALMDIAARGPNTDEVSSDPNSTRISLESVRMNVENLRNPPVQRMLLTAIDSAEGDLQTAQANIEAWYDSAMDRVSGHYKRSTQWVIFWIGLFTAIALNINTITIADYLYRNDAVRAVIIAQAEEVANDTTYTNNSYTYTKSDLESLGLPIGWSNGLATPHQPSGDGESVGLWDKFFIHVLGWLITALAASLGAPFWFDILNKVMVIRSTVKPHEKSPEEASEDRQLSSNRRAVANYVRNGRGNVVQHQNVPPATQDTMFSSPMDKESNIDGCSVKAEKFTPDEDLPPAEGGVA